MQQTRQIDNALRLVPFSSELVSSNLFFNKKSAKLDSNRIEICKTSISREVRQGEEP